MSGATSPQLAPRRHAARRGLDECVLRPLGARGRSRTWSAARCCFDGVGGVIVETESYERDDPACHAHVGLTERTAPLFGPPGRAYVYFSYGIHACSTSSASPRGRRRRC